MVATTFDESFGIPVGTAVITADGESLGSVVDGDAYDLVVAQGWFFVTDFRVPLTAVDRFEDGRIYLRLTRAEVAAAGDDF